MSAPVILITGGSRGIGAATARLAAARGYRVYINYLRDSPTADALAAEIGATAIQGDVAIESDVVRMFDQIGALAALVNNAGTLEAQSRLDQMDSARLARIFATNVSGSFLCAREAIRRMSTRYGGPGAPS